MKILAILALSLVFFGCSKKDTVNLPDLEPRVALLEANDKLQDLRLDTLEVQVSDLQGRMTQAEDDIDSNEEDILELFDLVADLDSELSDLRDELRDEVRSLRRADRQTRRMVRNKVRRLRRALSREIRQRQLADNNLQSQINDVEDALDRSNARQAVINRFLTRGLFMTNVRISQLQRQISYYLRVLDRRLDRVESAIRDINDEIVDLQNQMSTMQAQIDDVESRLVSVVYPCGDGNSEEVLLDTQDGLVAYFQQVRTQTIRFSDSITIQGYTIPGHYDKYCKDTNFFNGECNDYDYRYISGFSVPTQSYGVSDTARIPVLRKAYLDVLDDGNYRTTDGFSCNFTISNGEVL